MEFHTIRAFQDRILENPVLDIPPGEALRIKDVRILNFIPKNHIEDCPVVEDQFKFVFSQLAELIAPLGKSFSLDLPAQSISWTIADNFEIIFPAGAKLTAKKAESIFIRVSRLFPLMIATSRLELTLDDTQELYLISLKEEAFEGPNFLEKILS